MEIHKNIRIQDSGLKLKPVHSGESGINISNDILALIFKEQVVRESNTDITFTIYKEDFVKALCFIITKLPLYKTTSKDAVEQTYSLDFYLKYYSKIEDFFDKDTSKKYTCNLLLRNDGRNYLNKLKVGNFSIRDFLVEDITELIFGDNEDGSLYLRISNVEDFNSTPAAKLLISEKQHCKFALKCLTYFKDTPLWLKINEFVDSFSIGDSIKISGSSFHLTGLFKYETEDQLLQLNTPRRRWYTDPFPLKGKVVYLSTEWYPGDTENKYQLEIPELGKFITECFGNEYSVVRNADTWELWQNGDTKSKSDISYPNPVNCLNIPFSISRLITYINETGLLYDSTLIKRFAFSLMSKRFLILSGLAGSGKTQLALAFASALIEDKKQMCVVSVGADWTNREPLLGFPNALQEGSYVLPEYGTLELLIEAGKPENAHKPFFLILDEMNMSYVERYFADFLSAMESHKPIALWNGSEDSHIPESVSLPKNLFIIGTINVDETTYMFSPKVLDRANVIEFKISEDEMEQFLDEMKPVDCDCINFKAADMGESFVELSTCSELAGDEKMKKTLKSFFINLKSVNAEFGYRSATEIYRFINQAKKNDDSESKLSDNQILDCAMVQKLLPKLHGSRKKLEPVLQALWKECFDSAEDKEKFISKENVLKAKYPLTADKLQRMYEAAYSNGFTSFAEA